MHFHMPKPIHGWRQFFGEVGIIVLGVLIALGFEEVATTIRDESSKREAADAVYAELRQNLSFIVGRLETQACVEHRLDELGDLLGAAETGPLATRPQWIGQPSAWFTSDQAWLAATGSGRASMFSPEEQNGLAAVYVTTSQFVEAENREQEAWAQLRGLEGWTGPLGKAGRVHFTSALQSARYQLWATRITAEEALIRGKAVGIVVAQPHTMTNGYAIPHAVCLPMDTPRVRALQILSKDSPPWGQPK